MPESIDISSSLSAIYEGEDNDRLEVLRQYARDMNDVLGRTVDNNNPTVDGAATNRMRGMLFNDLDDIQQGRYIELLDEDKRPDRFRPYTYMQLPSSRHIRLLQLEGEFETFRKWSIIAGKLIAVPLDEAPKYEALSYTWGTREKTVPILVDEKRILVTPNLAVALQYSRGITKDESKCWLWIDQICINQDDLDERSQQVRSMRKIYQKSTQTTIWLGLNHQAALRLRERLFSKIWPYIKADPTNAYQRDYLLAARRRPKEIPEDDDEIWADLADLLCHPWFRRIWVVQEARASANKPGVSIRIGKLSIGWHYVAQIMIWLLQKGFSSVQHRLKNLVFVARIFNSGTLRLPLLRQLQETRRFQATDARDKVFALTGIVEEGEDESQLPECLQPDYTKSDVEVYQAVTVYLIKQSTDLQVLSYVQHITPDTAEDVDLPEVKVPSDNMPSWVVRWESEHANGSPIIDAAFFNASAGRALDMKILKKLGALKIKGVLVDRVTYVSNIFQNSTWILSDELLATQNPVFDVWQEVKARSERYPTEGVVEQVLVMALLCGKRITGERATSDTKLFLSFYAYLHCAFIMRKCYSSFKQLRLMTTNLTIVQQVEVTDNPISRAEPGSLTHRIHESLIHLGAGQDPNYFIREMDCTRQRKVFTTSTGYVGMGPAAMQEDDIVVILYGGRVPYILRAQGGHFSFIGESYVHGLMDGEGLEVARRTGGTPQYFELW